VKLLTAIERLIKRRIERIEVEGFTGLDARPGDAELDQADDRPPRSPRSDGRGNPRNAPRGGNGRTYAPRQPGGQAPHAHRAAQPQPARSAAPAQQPRPAHAQPAQPARQPQRSGAPNRSALTGGPGFRGTTGGK
jgi:ATP-dependent RNA helicase RhlE